jgi:hypothetical protein
MGSAGFQPAASDFQSDTPRGILPAGSERPRAGSAKPSRQDAGKSGLEARAPHFHRVTPLPECTRMSRSPAVSRVSLMPMWGIVRGRHEVRGVAPGFLEGA